MSLEQIQNIIADPSFVYKGDSLEVIEIVNAIKNGYRLSKEGSNENEYMDACSCSI